MATITKTSTAATLNLAATNAWDLARLPNITPDSDIATWVSGSLGGAYTGAVTATGLAFNSGFTTNSSFAGLVTIGTSGITMTAGSTPRFTFSTGIDVGSNNQNWVLSGNPTTLTAQLAVSTLSGSGNVNVSMLSGASIVGGLLYFYNTSTFTGTLTIGVPTWFDFNGTNSTASATGSTGSTNVFPNMTALNIVSGGSLNNLITNSGQVIVPWNVTIDSGGSFITGVYNTSGTGYYNYTGTITGLGTLDVAAYGASVNVSTISRVRTNSTPANLWVTCNGTLADTRSVKWEYAGLAATYNTEFRVNQVGSVSGASAFFTIENLGGKYTTTGGIDLNTNATTQFARTLTIAATNADFEFQGVVKSTDSGGLSINKTGANKLILKGDNTFAGTTTLTAGGLELGHQNALAFSTLTLVSGGNSPTVTAGVTSVNIGNITVPTGATLVLPSGVEFCVGNKNVATTQTGAITGGSTAILAKIGTATMTLSIATNSFGTFKLYNGTVSFGALAHLGGATAIQIGKINVADGALAFNYTGGTSLTLGAAFSIYEGFSSSSTQDIVFNNTFAFNNNPSVSYQDITHSGNLTFNGQVSSPSNTPVRFFPAIGNGVTLSQSNANLLCSLTIASGYIKPTNDGAFGPSSVTTFFDVSSGAYILIDTDRTINQPSRTIRISGTGNGNGALYFNSSSISHNSPISLLVADASITSGASSTVSLSSLNTSSYAATVLSAASSTISFSGALSGSGTFNKSGAGTVVLDQTGTFTGTSNVTAGVLSVSKSDATGGTVANINVSGGTIKTTVSTGTRLKTKDLTFSGGNLKIGA